MRSGRLPPLQGPRSTEGGPLSDDLTSRTTGPGSPPSASRSARVLGVHRGLPTNRAVVGGLLVAVALIGTWWAAAGGSQGPSSRYVVAARAIGPGEHLAASDMRLVAMDLPRGLRSHALTATGGLGEVVTTGPLEAGELVQTSHLARGTGGRTTRELSLVVDADWAVGGTLQPGDRIDVLVTYGDGTGSQTDVVLAGATVRRVTSARDGGLGATRSQTITVAVSDPEKVKAVTNAARAGAITITRATGVSTAAKTGAYRPPTKAPQAGEGGDGPAQAAPKTSKGGSSTTPGRKKGRPAGAGG